jgi:fluoride exporter
MQRFFWICFAGAIGTGARYLVGSWSGSTLGSTFPFGTLIVNVVGCFLIAAIMQLATTMTSFPPTLRLALTTGFLGGFTTYSSFNYETTRMLQDGTSMLALVNVLATSIGSFAAGLLGLLIAKQLLGS